MKKTTKELYDKMYEDKLKSHFMVPYPKFPYNLDKDTINLSEERRSKIFSLSIGTISRSSKGRKRSVQNRKPGNMATSVQESRIGFYKTNKTDRLAKIQDRILAKTLDNRAKNSPNANNDYSSHHSQSQHGIFERRSRVSSAKKSSRKRSTSRASFIAKNEDRMQRIYQNEDKI